MRSAPLPVTYDDIHRASRLLQGVAHRTPVLTSRRVDELTRARVFFKCENFQRTGSFKFRGAYNALSACDEEQKRAGVVAFSAGNHAQGVALAAHLLNTRAVIVMPSDAPTAKIAATRDYGAQVVLYDRKRESREEIARRLVDESGSVLIPPFDHPAIIAGQGTACAELLEEVGPLDILLVPVGGGGLLAGSALAAAHLAPDCAVIGVEPQAGNDAQRSLRTGTIVEIPVPDTIADGARTQRIGNLVFPILQAHVREILTVTDEELSRRQRFLAERMKIIVEPTGCLPAAALFSHRDLNLQGKRVGVILSGGNVDLS